MFEKIKALAFGNGFDAGQNEALSYLGPMLDDWDRLSNDEKGQVRAIAPLFVAKLEDLKSTMERT
jgi:hypothetical protein